MATTGRGNSDRPLKLADFDVLQLRLSRQTLKRAAAQPLLKKLADRFKALGGLVVVRGSDLNGERDGDVVSAVRGLSHNPNDTAGGIEKQEALRVFAAWVIENGERLQLPPEVIRRACEAEEGRQ